MATGQPLHVGVLDDHGLGDDQFPHQVHQAVQLPGIEFHESRGAFRLRRGLAAHFDGGRGRCRGRSGFRARRAAVVRRVFGRGQLGCRRRRAVAAAAGAAGEGSPCQGGPHALPELPGWHDDRFARLHALELVADFAGEVL